MGEFAGLARSGVLACVYVDLYDGLMTDTPHHALRLPKPTWRRYGQIVGNRSGDLKTFMDWAPENPGALLAEDCIGPFDFTATMRVEPLRWELFVASLGPADCSAALRCYINWRIAHPDAPLDSARRVLACV